MRKLILSLSALALAVPTAAVPIASADAQTRHRTHHYRGHTVRHYRTCRHSPGTAGLIGGGVGGALVGRSVLGHGLLGTVAGGVGGALAGRAIDRSMTAHRRCR